MLMLSQLKNRRTSCKINYCFFVFFVNSVKNRNKSIEGNLRICKVVKVFNLMNSIVLVIFSDHSFQGSFLLISCDYLFLILSVNYNT